MDEPKQPQHETKQPGSEYPQAVTPETELVDETRDRLAQRRRDPSDKPRKPAEQPDSGPWFLHPDERREFGRLVNTSREMARQIQAEARATGMSMVIQPEQAAGQIQALCEALERSLEGYDFLDKERERAVRENAGLLNTVARWQDYGEGRIPKPPDDAELPELPAQPDPAANKAGESEWEALYRKKVRECQLIQSELDGVQLELEKLRAAGPPAHVSYVVNFIAGREAAGS